MGRAEVMRERTSLVILRLSRALSENEENLDFGVKWWGLIERKIWE